MPVFFKETGIFLSIFLKKANINPFLPGFLLIYKLIISKKLNSHRICLAQNPCLSRQFLIF